MTLDEIEAIAHRTAWRYRKSTDPHHSDTYTFNRSALMDFAAKLVDAAPTTPGQQDDEALEVLRELVEARDAYNASETTPQLRDNSTRLRAAGKAARALLNKRGEK